MKRHKGWRAWVISVGDTTLRVSDADFGRDGHASHAVAVKLLSQWANLEKDANTAKTLKAQLEVLHLPTTGKKEVLFLRLVVDKLKTALNDSIQGLANKKV